MATDNTPFDQRAATWDENPMRTRLAQDIANAIQRNIRIIPEMDVLDFGCGTGLLAFHFAPSVRSITGADTSQGMLDVLIRKSETFHWPNVRALMLTDDRTWPMQYDLIISSMAFHHVEDTQRLLADLYRAVKPGGYLCFADLDAEDGSFHDDKTGVYHAGFDRTVLRTDLQRAGFSLLSDETATTITKPVQGDLLRTFPIFLMVGRKEDVSVTASSVDRFDPIIPAT